jgi:hypothetical protein
MMLAVPGRGRMTSRAPPPATSESAPSRASRLGLQLSVKFRTMEIRCRVQVRSNLGCTRFQRLSSPPINPLR